MEVLDNFDLLKPGTLDEAVAFVNAQPDARFLAGGTDLIVNLRRGIGDAAALIDLSGIEEMKSISLNDDGLRIGAAITLDDLAKHDGIHLTYSVISQAAGEVAGPTHRRIATVGGNLCLDTRCIYYNQSHWWRQSNDFCLKYKGDICHVAPKSKQCFAAFSGDLAPALLVYDATVDLIGPKGKRTIALDDLYVDDGAAHLALGEGEFLVSVNIPHKPFQYMAYEKTRVRDSIDFPLAGVAIAFNIKGDSLNDLKIAFTGTNCRPIQVTGLGEFQGLHPTDDVYARIMKLANKQIKPMQSTSMPSTYRRAVAAKSAIAVIKKLWSDHASA